jgi:hypothetical protein
VFSAFVAASRKTPLHTNFLIDSEADKDTLCLWTRRWSVFSAFVAASVVFVWENWVVMEILFLRHES